MLSDMAVLHGSFLRIYITSLVWPDRFFSVFICDGATINKNGKKRSGHARLVHNLILVASYMSNCDHCHQENNWQHMSNSSY